MAGGTSQLISADPEELQFQFELEKQSFCDLKVANTTAHHVAFKVKTTSPKKFFVRPNTGVLQPWDSCMIRVTLQAQREYPPDMQSKDKFLLQSTKVPSNIDVDELSPDTFNKEGGKTIEELKLRVVYVSPNSATRSSEDRAKKNLDANLMHRSANPDDSQALQRLKDERDTALQQAQQLQQELEFLKRRRNRTNDPGFSTPFAFVVGLIGFMVGFLFKLLFSSPAAS